MKSRNNGEWKRISPAGIYECSCCGQNVMTSDIECYKFCHGCGADMRGLKMDQSELDLLSKKMNRIKELMDFSKLSIEELLGMWAEDHGGCDKCPLYLKHICCEGKLDEFACHEIWAKYLGGFDFE